MPFITKTIKPTKPIKLFLLLMRELQISQNSAQKFIDSGRVVQNGRVISDKAAVVDSEIEVIVFEPESRGLSPLFEAKDFAIFDKPSGIMVHPRNRKSGYTLIDEVRFYFGKDANITHRIDKETSGLVLVSKCKEAEKRIKQMFEHKRIQKSYLALVQGIVKEELFIDAPIAKNRDYSKIKLKVLIDPKGKSAQTVIKPLNYFKDRTLVEAIPLTGRQHQIRAHLFHVKHPIVGDPIYGVPIDVAIAYLDGKLSLQERLRYTKAPRLMLHAYSLRFSYNDTTYHIVSKQDWLKSCF